ESGRAPEELPHDVEISRPFFMDVYEVTQEEFSKVTGGNPSYFSAGGEGRGLVPGTDTRRFPVENVSWNDARQFCVRLSELPGEVGEWCADRYDGGYYAASPRLDPAGPADASLPLRLLRGGTWQDDAIHLRSASRRNSLENFAHRAYGFRVVLEVRP